MHITIDEEAIQSVEYEDELDLLVLTRSGFVELVDNLDGTVIREIHLEFWPRDREWKHTVELYRDK